MKRLALIVAFTAVTAVAQTGQKSRFEVVSIKHNLETGSQIFRLEESGRFVAVRIPVKYLIGRAFGVDRTYVLGGPNWIESDVYSIEAKADGTIASEQLQGMLQSLLAERFQLKAHQERRELPVYELVVAGGGAKIKRSDDQTPAMPPRPTGEPVPANAPIPRGAFGFGPDGVNGAAVPLERLTTYLKSLLGRPVLDKTGLTGLFDMKLRFAPGSEGTNSVFARNPDTQLQQADLSAPSLFTALQEQLGLRLRATRDPLDVIVIDSIQRPTEN